MPTQSSWPEELDALTAAPHHHALLFENEFVRVLDTRVPPGQTVPLHTHQWPGPLYILSWSDFIRRNADGLILLDSRTIARVPKETAIWSACLPPHTLENIGNSELRAISVELKNTHPA
jgi:hypothetical protein